jgi:sugar/nucleoside kinase (ribokinase family)
MTFDLPLPPRASRPYDVVGYGENSLDFLGALRAWPEADAKVPLRSLEILPGGQTATAIAAAARLGSRARYIGAFGDDSRAAEIRRSLATVGVDVVAVERKGVSTRCAMVLVDDEGRRTVMEHRDPRLSLDRRDVEPAIFQSGRILLVDATDVPGALLAAGAAREAGVPVMLDVDKVTDQVEALLGSADVLIVPFSFATAFTGHQDVGHATAALSALLAPRPVICTLGPEGSLARYRGQEIRTPARTVEVRDTTGAGDAFRGAFAARWAAKEGLDLASLLEYASAAAALACRALGAQTALPLPDEVDSLLGVRT